MSRDYELLHSDFETIEKYDQDYRISTRVKFFASGTYKIKTTLWKSYGGSVHGDPLYRMRERTSSADDVEEILQEQVDVCSEKVVDIEKSKALDIDVTVK